MKEMTRNYRGETITIYRNYLGTLSARIDYVGCEVNSFIDSTDEVYEKAKQVIDTILERGGSFNKENLEF